MSKVEAKASTAMAEDKSNEWDVDFSSGVKKWDELNGGEKVKAVAINVAKISVIVLSLYLFICSLSFLADGFRLVAGRQAGEIFQNSAIFNNPIAGSNGQPTHARAHPPSACLQCLAWYPRPPRR